MLLGTNVEVEFKGDKMIVTVDLSKENGQSSTGKNIKIASTGGNMLLPIANSKAPTYLGLNCYKAKPS